MKPALGFGVAVAGAAVGLVAYKLLGGTRRPRPAAAPSSRSSSPTAPPLGGGPALLAAAQRALRQGVAETFANTGPVVDRYLAAVGISPPANWCAAAVTAWMREAYMGLGGPPPIAGGARAKAFKEQLEARGTWIPAAKLTAAKVRPGDIAVWHRGDPGSWMGHIGVVESVDRDGKGFHTIEGNSGTKSDRVALMYRTFADPRLLGIGSLDPLLVV
ncbi:CHAP domain-containing protein [Polyangium mundeleinium]|uniref:CHAP domain-containing protein n=1 Tax=Polyangium mundeleinium TaxID=2995306 RepID=A0ABT5EXY5_9BACT|nr:CHAP domain-containing protein [Polyangium mundeleinium]MDC0746690.1 CHAP domain-containing protein [Polyangium mundeleinium]